MNIPCNGNVIARSRTGDVAIPWRTQKRFRAPRDCFVALLLAMTAMSAAAQTYPVKPIRFILPVAASSTSDTLGRLIATQLSARLGQSTTWQGLAVPAATPRDIVNRLNAESVKIVHSEEIRARLEAMGTDPVGSSPEQFAAYVRSETAKWGKLVRSIGLRLE